MSKNIESTVITALRDIIGDPTIETADNFFAVGGDSLSAVELMERVEGELSIEFPLDAVFASETIAQVVEACIARTNA